MRRPRRSVALAAVQHHVAVALRAASPRACRGRCSSDRARCSTNSKVQPSPRSIPLAQGSTAPSRMVSEGSGMMRSGSISARVPRPWQSGQEPSGLLKEKLCGVELAEGEAAGVAGVLLGEEAVVPLVLLGIDARPDLLLLVGLGDDQRALALAQRRLHRVGEAAAHVRLHHQAIDHQLDVVLQLLVEREPLLEASGPSRRRAPGRSRACGRRRAAPVLALAVLHQRRQQQDARRPRAGRGWRPRSAARVCLPTCRPQPGQCCTPMEA